MSLFESLNTSISNRRKLFWLICIPLRTTIAVFFFVALLDWARWSAYVVGSIGISAGLSFLSQRFRDNEPNVWWYRTVHFALWTAGGVLAIVFDQPTAAYIVLGVFLFDVLFGVVTAVVKCPFRDESPLGNMLVPMEVSQGWSWFGLNDTDTAALTPWSIIHLGSGVVMGIVSFYAFPSAPYQGCLIGTLLIFLWEAIENVAYGGMHPTFTVERKIYNQDSDIHFSVCCVDFRRGIDSSINLASDVAVGLIGLWGTAYLLTL